VKVVFVLFDSLNRGALGAYGGDAVLTPNFDRFAKQSVVFDSHFVGSLPCMPARRDMHTGRLNYMHRSWGPLEPFDNSFPRLLSDAGIYSHIVSDHFHYFEDGGAGYTNAFDTWEFIRGQENDPWVALVEPPIERYKRQFSERHYKFDLDPKRATRERMARPTWKKLRHAVNRERIAEDDDFPTIACFNKSLEFIHVNHQAQNWFLQVEAFDPHEPFHAPERFKELYLTGWNGGILDWPKYEKIVENPEEIREIKSNYAALVTMCDEQFGRLLGLFDELNLWSDTCLILTTDHGFLLSGGFNGLMPDFI
jgi:arylsulfatase A-like enzyme